MKRVEETTGHPWWVVHRAHLHAGLVEVAIKEGADIIIGSTVTRLDHESGHQVLVETSKGKIYHFDLLIGSDGIKSIVRKTLFPDVKPTPPTTNCAYRALIPYTQVQKDPVACTLVKRPTMEVWMTENAYIISYPISDGTQLNLVLSHHRPHPVASVEEVDMDEFRATYQDFDPRIKRIVDMVPSAKRWPLLVTGPLDTWSNPNKKVVLIGDAAHSMVNHMAQGAATSMEDGAFLAKCVGEVVKGNMNLREAVALYEKERMPRAYEKQQISFLNGQFWQLPEGPEQEARDRAMKPELEGRPFIRSPNLYGDPSTVLEVYGYDAERHAEEAIRRWKTGKEERNERTGVTKRLEDKHFNWFKPKANL
ncbi:uncharacterized protein KY384_003371 [Bacidia gigantensis]|uniref:uncharacterized protein n=1 Tax=Bacidia gigantensis TaxID=2732470 RepID=UPI001D043414|nr:uncharacterized protein KY384_003371 [Bacidia gigantensis]KAG8531739.1 hypothetical protein KY384_003371 [Bacidia gigantensis]